MNDELKPCPFCGAKPRARTLAIGAFAARVECTVCLADGPARSTLAEAIALWNTRAALVAAGVGGEAAVNLLRDARDVLTSHMTTDSGDESYNNDDVIDMISRIDALLK